MRRLYFWYRHKKTGYFRFNFRIWHPRGTGGICLYFFGHCMGITPNNPEGPSGDIRAALEALVKAAKRFQMEMDEDKRIGRTWDRLYEAIEKAEKLLAHPPAPQTTKEGA